MGDQIWRDPPPVTVGTQNRKFHLLDSLTGGGAYSPENAEAELEAYVQERQMKLRETLRETERFLHLCKLSPPGAREAKARARALLADGEGET